MTLARCDNWPVSKTFGCAKTGEWTILNKSMNYNDSSQCVRECGEKARTGKEAIGCCQLKPGVGCAWKPGSHAVTGGTGIAVTCKKGKKKIRVFSIDLSQDIFKDL